MKKFFLIIFSVLILSSCNLGEHIKINKVNLTGNNQNTPIQETNTGNKNQINIDNVGKIPSKEGSTKDDITFYFDYPIFKESQIHETIKKWGESIIENAKTGYKNIKYNKNPQAEVFFVFDKFQKNNLTSIVYKVTENLERNNSKYLVKIFYMNEKGEQVSIDNLFSKNKKEELKKILIENVKNLNYVYHSNITGNIDNCIDNLGVYFDNEDVTFLFKPNTIAPESAGIMELNLKFDKIKNLINPKYFNGKKFTLNKKDQEKFLNESNDKKNEKKETNTEKKKYVALTFDDGPNKETTPKLLEILKENDIKATFFVLGKNSSYFPEIVKKTHNQGHEIGSHSRSHPSLPLLKNSKLAFQIDKTDSEIKKIIGEKPTLFRPPYGNYNKRVKKAIGRTIVLWNVDSMDRKNKDIDKNLDTVMSEVKNGSIILFHDIYETSINTIPPLVKKLKEQGYEFLTVTELLKKGGIKNVESKVCYGEFFCKN